ncbi:MAG TPA: response regulator transcription factor [Longilinea sp.]|nr:response regulator transcription factor [Longilinea sp.]
MANDDEGLIRLGVVSEQSRLNAWLVSAVDANDRIVIIRVANSIELLNSINFDVLVLAGENLPLQELDRLVEQTHIKGVIIFTSHINVHSTYLKKPAFPVGWLSLDTDIRQFYASVEAVFAGLSVYVSRDDGVLPPEEELLEPLSKREIDVLQLIINGMSNRQIAAALFVSENTVKYHLTNIYLKLGVSRRGEAIRKAIGNGLVAL